MTQRASDVASSTIMYQSLGAPAQGLDGSEDDMSAFRMRVERMVDTIKDEEELAAISYQELPPSEDCEFPS